jgi:hypothetical protein
VRAAKRTFRCDKFFILFLWIGTMTMTFKSNILLDAQTILIGYVNRGATRDSEATISESTTIPLNTKLDAASIFSVIASHPGHGTAVTVSVEVAPVLDNGTIGTWFEAAEVVIPAAGGRVETYINGHDLAVDAADAPNVTVPCIAYARAVCADHPATLTVGLTATVRA